MQNHLPAIDFLTPSTSSAPSQRQNSNATPEVSFNQVLNSQIAERPNPPAREASAPAPTPAPQASAKPQENNNKTQESAKPEEKGNPASAASSSTGNASGTSSAQGKDATKDADASNATDVAAASQVDPTAALLALVASFQSASPQAASKAATSADTASDSATVQDATTSGKSTTPLTLAASTKETASKDDKASTGFAAVLAPEAKAEDSDKAQLTSTDLAPKATPKADHAQVSAATDSKAQATPQALQTQESNATPVAGRTLKPDAAPVTSASDTKATSTTVNALAGASAASNTPAIAKLQQQIAPRVGNPGWDQALGQHVVYLASSGQQTASLTLNPPDLGPLQVVLHISNDQASANFSAAQPEVRAALEAAMPKLREMMSDAGIVLGNATVSTSLPNQQQSSQQGEPSRQQGGNTFGADASNEDIPRTVVTRPIHNALGLVDTFV